MSPPVQEPLYVIGHRNPDADAICSAIGYAAYLRASRKIDARAACCGEPNVRTAWVLKYAQVEQPKLLLDVRPNAGSVCRRDVVVARKDETVLGVYRKMVQHGFRSIPVVDLDGQLAGMTSMQELAQLFLPATADDADANRHVKTSQGNMVAALEAKVLNQVTPSSEVKNIILTVAASSLATAEARVHRFPRSSVVMLVGDRPEVHRMGIDTGAGCLIVTGGFDVDPEIIKLADQAGILILQTRYDTASAAQLVRFSRPIVDALEQSFLHFGSKVPLKEILHVVNDSNQPLFPVINEESQQLTGVFSKSDLVDTPRTRLALVDHNEFSQAVMGADEADIEEVIDHHRLSGNLRTKEPVRFINEPVGSTCTIVAMMYRMQGLQPDRSTAICLCAGMISDTLNLTSPTTTHIDREFLPWLASIAGISVEQFTTDFFAAGSILRDKPASAALESDRKEFEENGWKISISQIEELGLDELWPHEQALLQALEKLRAERKLHFACLLVTDITCHDSVLFTSGDPRVMDAIEYPEIKNDIFELRGVVSRKKQLFPYLGRVLGKLSAPEY